MTRSMNPDSALEKLCNAAMQQRLGDVSGLPQELVEYLLKVYREFISSYLNLLRQKENKSADWIPERLSIDSELEDGMRHYFSDYQHITREFNRINQQMDRLQEIEPDTQRRLYRHAIDEILSSRNQEISQADQNEKSGQKGYHRGRRAGLRLPFMVVFYHYFALKIIYCNFANAYNLMSK